jgi:hypothetical protein
LTKHQPVPNEHRQSSAAMMKKARAGVKKNVLSQTPGRSVLFAVHVDLPLPS